MGTSDAKPVGRATIEDVATRAGVSVATVSRALRGLPNVAPSTRQRVAEVAADLRYRPHPAATRLAAGRTQTITIAVPTLNGWYFSTVVAGAEPVCTEEGYDFIVIGVGSTAELHRLTGEDASLERRTDGLILVDLLLPEHEADALAARGLTIGTIGSVTPGRPAVVVDDEEVGELATRHLVDLGHTRIGLIGGMRHDPLSFDVPKARRRGYERVLGQAGLPLDEEIMAPGDFGIDGGQVAMAGLLDLVEPPTAVFVMSDEMAFGAMMEMHARGLRPGVDVSLVGVDDHEFSRVMGLTTVRQSVASHGAVAARMLIEHMDARNGRADPAAVPDPSSLVRRCPVELVRRTSTGAPGRAPS